MEPPTANTPCREGNKDLNKLNYIGKLIISKNNKEYIMEFRIENKNYQNFCIIKVSNSQEIYYFSNSYTLEEIHNLSVVFQLYNKLEDIISSIFLTSEYELVESNDELNITFCIFLPNGKKKMIQLYLKKYFLEEKDIINHLIEENKILKEKISQNENEIKLLKEENKKIWEELDKLNNINIFAQNYENINKMNFAHNNNSSSKINSDKQGPPQCLSLDSKIINSRNDIDFIFNYIHNRNHLDNFWKTMLLYRATKNGDKTEICHRLCDSKENIIILIESSEGYKFGGYCKIGFKTINDKKYQKYIIDNNSFIFSVDSKKIYPSKKDKEIIYHGANNLGLCFYECLYFSDNFLNKNDSFVCKKNSKYMLQTIPSGKEINGGNEYFKCKELEVFQLL